jgi:hypothetical protein
MLVHGSYRVHFIIERCGLWHVGTPLRCHGEVRRLSYGVVDVGLWYDWCWLIQLWVASRKGRPDVVGVVRGLVLHLF